MRHRCWPVRIISLVTILGFCASQETNLGPNHGFDRATCFNQAITWLQDNDADTSLFYEIPSKNQSGMILLTLPGCHKFCGEPTLYFDWPSRLTIWIIPILLLVSNIQLAPVSKKRFATIFHAIGDPIDSLWSLAHKAYVWHRLYQIALEELEAAYPDLVRVAARKRLLLKIRIVATVLSGVEEVSGANIRFEEFYRHIVRTLYPADDSDAARERRRKWNLTATQLVNGRTSDFLHTTLALIVYYFGIITALIDSLGGGGGTPPGGRIACAIFLSWLVPLALLSNTFGSFSSRMTCLDVMLRFFEPTAGEAVPPPLGEFGTPYAESVLVVSSWNDYFDSAMWTGAMHTFRPWKVAYVYQSSSPSNHQGFLGATIAAMAFFTPFISMLGAFWIIYCAIPSGFTCRHIWVIGVSFAWILSAIFTNLLYVYTKSRIKQHWWLVFWKDVVVGLAGTVGFPIASTIGAFNSCSCWSSAWPSDKGFVPVGVADKYKERQLLYSVIIAVTQVLHVLSYLVIVLRFFNAIKITWWRESDIREQWEQDHGEWPSIPARYLRLVVGNSLGQRLRNWIPRERLRRSTDAET